MSPGGGYNGGPVYGGMNTGNNVYNYGQLPSPPNGYASPAPQQAYRDSMAQLDQLRQSVKDDPESLRQVQDLIREMQRLDPSRFPGNPAIVEELHNRVLGDVDKLELQLRSAPPTPNNPVRCTAPTRTPCPRATRTPWPIISAA